MSQTTSSRYYATPYFDRVARDLLSALLNQLALLILTAGMFMSVPAWAAPALNAGKSSVVANPTTVPANGSTTSTITVTLRKSNGSISGVNNTVVTLSAGSGSSVISPSSVTTNNGIAVFTVRNNVVQSVTYTATVTEPGNGAVTLSQRATVNFVRAAPTVAKSFNPTTIAANGTSRLTITLTNPNTASISGVSFNDIYPTGMVNSGNPAVATTCGGTAAATANGATLALSGGTIPASTSCSVSVTVTAATAATYTNATGLVTSTNAASGASASAALTVRSVSATNSTVTASPTTVLANGTSTSTITVTLRDGANLAVANKTVTLAKSGGSSVISAASGTSNVNGVVTFTVTNLAAETTTYTATVTDTPTSIQLTQTASVTFVKVPVFKTFSVSPVAINGLTTLSVTLTNSSSAPITGAGFSDLYPAGQFNNATLVNKTAPAVSSGAGSCGTGVVSGTSGGSSIGISGATIPAPVPPVLSNTCTVSVQVASAVADTFNNVATSTAGDTSLATLIVTAISPSLSTVTVSPATVLANGISSSTITVTLKDGLGNNVAGKTVTLIAGTGSSTITALTNTGGIATFSVTDTTAEGPIVYTAVDTTDNITVTQTVAVTFTRMTAPTVAKSFSPSTIADYGTTMLTVTLTNPNNAPITGVAFTDTYPATGALANSSILVLSNTCGGSNPGTVGDGTSLTLTGGSIAASGTCAVSVQVTAQFPGAAVNIPIVNSTGPVTSANANDGTAAAATLTVVDVSAANSTVVTDKSSVPADNASTAIITVTLRDGAGNPVADRTVSLTRSSGTSSTITTINGVTDAFGVATFSVKDAVVESVTYTATDVTNSGSIVVTQQAVVTFGAAASGFNAFETATPAGSVTGIIKTKISGVPFGFHIVALTPTPTAVSTGFTGAVKVELIDSSSGSVCATWPVIQTLANQTFLASEAGRHPVAATVTEPNAWKNVRVRISYPVTSPTAVSCSTDNFAIRPDRLAVQASDTDRTSAGTTNLLNNVLINGSRVHNAGSPFRISATAYNAASAITSNYSGTPTTVLSACISGTACIPGPGTLTLGTWSGSGGNVATTTATYNDVGAFTLKLIDSTFASVDASDGSSALEREITGTVDVGRFVPDHFELSGGTFVNRTDMATCGAASTFTYTGETFDATFTLTACNGSATCTGNPALTTTAYAGSYARLASTSLPAFGFLGASSPSAPVAVSGGAVTGAWTQGVLNSALTGMAVTRSLPHAPYTAFQLGIAPADLDGVVLNASALTLNLDTTPGNEHAPVAGTTTTIIRFGRLKLGNGYGSELLNLPIPLEAHYWNGTAFARNLLDSCTPIASANIIMGNYLRTLAPGSSCKTAAVLGTPALAAGLGALRMTAPGNASGSVDLAVNLQGGSGTTCSAKGGTELTTVPAGLSYLQGNWTGSTYTQNPTARATFGIYKSGPVIYMREMY